MWVRMNYSGAKSEAPDLIEDIEDWLGVWLEERVLPLVGSLGIAGDAHFFPFFFYFFLLNRILIIISIKILCRELSLSVCVLQQAFKSEAGVFKSIEMLVCLRHHLPSKAK